MVFGSATSGIRPFALLTLLCALLFLPGLASIPPTDRDEARFMQASKQMLESGDWVHLRFQDEPRNKKPAGIYWMQATSVKIFGQDPTVAWPYRLPSVLMAWLAVLATCWCGTRLFNREAGLAAGAILATSMMTIIEAHIAKTDAALLGCTALSMAMLAQHYTATRPSLVTALLFWFSLGIGILIKGPVILLVVGGTILTLGVADRRWTWLKTLRPLTGIALTLVVVLPWLMAISSSNQSSFVADSIQQDLLPKLLGAQESHGAWPGTYLVTALATLWPWSYLAPFALVLAWRHRAEPVVRFCLAWLIPAWIVFELVPTKLPHYTLPLYPALALLTAWAFSLKDEPLRRTFNTLWGTLYFLLWAVVCSGLAIGVAYATGHYGGPPLGAAVAGLALGLGGLAILMQRKANPLIGLVGAGSLLGVSLTTLVVPNLTDLAVSPRIAAIAAQHSLQNGKLPPIALVGYHEPSAVFLLGTDTLLTDENGAGDFLSQRPGALAVVPADISANIKAKLENRGQRVQELGVVEGTNYSRGKPVRLVILGTQ